MSDDEEAARGRALRDRKQTRRAIERDVAADVAADQEFDIDDDLGKAGSKRRRSSMLQSLAQSSRQSKPVPAYDPTLGSDFLPLRDLKGVDATEVVGRRIRVWYEAGDDEEKPVLKGEEPKPLGGEEQKPPADSGERSGLKPSVGIVTFYGDEGRLHAVYDGEEEFDGLWIDGNDEWEWVDESEVGPPPPAPPVPGCWRPSSGDGDGDGDIDTILGQVGDIDKIFLVRTPALEHTPPSPRAAADASSASPGGASPRHASGAGPAAGQPSSSGSAGLELFVKWKGLAHIHCQWVPQHVLERSDVVNKRRVARFLKLATEALPPGTLSQPGVVASNDGIRYDPGDEEAYNPEYDEVERIMATRTQAEDGLPPEFLVSGARSRRWPRRGRAAGRSCATRVPSHLHALAGAAFRGGAGGGARVPYRPPSTNFSRSPRRPSTRAATRCAPTRSTA